MISFVVPAHNEAACLASTLQAIHASACAVGQPYEILVVNDASTDATAEIARQNNAIVLTVNHRQIAATRNSGGRAAQGERLFFIDADTTINARAVSAALRAMDKGAAGGGAPALFDRAAPLYANVLVFSLGWFMRIAGVAGGAFMFCTRKAFHAVGGFDERLFGAEDAAMSWALKNEGPFVVLWPHVLTSSRRLRGNNGPRLIAILIRMAFFPKMLTERARVQKVWYESNRDTATHNSPAIRLFNVVMLVAVLLCATGPLWNLIPEIWIPRESLPGKIRVGIGVFSCHVALILWPCLYFLGRNLLRQRRWSERIKSAILIVISLYLAWGATRVVSWFWTEVYRQLAGHFTA